MTTAPSLSARARTAAPLAVASALLQQSLFFRQPPDTLLAQGLRGAQRFGQPLRQAIGDALFAALRELARWHWLVACLRGCPATPPDVTRLRNDPAACLDVMTLAWPAHALPLLAAADPAAGERASAWQARAAAVDLTSAPAWARLGLPPDWLPPLQAALGEELEALARALHGQAPLDLRVNALRSKREPVLAALQAAGLPADPTPHAPWGIRLPTRTPLGRIVPGVRGLVEVQDEGSQLIAALVGARRGETVVDFCAGAGGKTLALAADMRGSGRLYAFDTVARRLDVLQARARAAGIDQVQIMTLVHEGDPRLQRLAGKVDRVLVDAPCSGSGTVRRHPELLWRTAAADWSELAATQLRILRAAAALVRPGGRLVYATCSLFAQENEAVAAAFDAACAGTFEPLPAQDLLAESRVANPAALVAGPYLRLWPHRHRCDGFFAAAWQRRRL
jgi:16S rRNA (cytosine967-C5)-methyltransferase